MDWIYLARTVLLREHVNTVMNLGLHITNQLCGVSLRANYTDRATTALPTFADNIGKF
jgi:hypothetical protein